jgi:hypothetical protein
MEYLNIVSRCGAVSMREMNKVGRCFFSHCHAERSHSGVKYPYNKTIETLRASE